MALLRAYLMPHPPLAVDAVGLGKQAEISATIAAFNEAAAEIAKLSPETIIFITPHNISYSDYFHISPGDTASGDFSRFGAPDERLETEYDTELVSLITDMAEKSGLRAGTLGSKDAALDHGVTVPMWFINKHYPGDKYKTVRVSQSGFDPADHYRLGTVIARAAEQLGRKAVLIASGDLSHKMSARSSYGFAQEGPLFDRLFTEALSSGDFGALLAIPDGLRERAAECGYNSVTMLAGCFDGLGVTGRLLSYEGPFGIGYAVAEIIPGAPDNSRHFYIRHSEKMLADSREKRGTENAYRSLARMSLEHAILNNKTISGLPSGLPKKMLDRRAGVFVSIHKNGRLRGCIGTIYPLRESVAEEIMYNAVSAGLIDSRFEPVTAEELPFLTYKVDILSAPEVIAGLDELDVKRYGVIVSCGERRGLLLPNLDGIDTAEEQVTIARKKGGIADGEEVKLERFEVTRHE